MRERWSCTKQACVYFVCQDDDATQVFLVAATHTESQWTRIRVLNDQQCVRVGA